MTPGLALQAVAVGGGRAGLRRRMAQIVLVWLALWFGAGAAGAHEVRPAYLELVEAAPGIFAVTWKQPVLDGKTLKLEPQFPQGCTRADQRATATGATLVTRWTLTCTLDTGDITIAGLDRTLTDVFVRLQRREGETVSAVLRPGAPTLNLAGPPGAQVGAYFRLGVEHILAGYDHLLFVLGLILIVRPRQILTTLTAFTLAHSLTLAAAALAGFSLPGAPVEVIIAMSIALLGAEAVYRARGRSTLSQRWPWAIAFGFGLVHGFGFAGALAEIGLPKGAEALALLWFNLGVEAGQIAAAGAVVFIGAALARTAPMILPRAQILAAYAIGITGTYWAIARLTGMFT
jgi:HupE / UreJ protein